MLSHGPALRLRVRLAVAVPVADVVGVEHSDEPPGVPVVDVPSRITRTETPRRQAPMSASTLRFRSRRYVEMWMVGFGWRFVGPWRVDRPLDVLHDAVVGLGPTPRPRDVEGAATGGFLGRRPARPARPGTRPGRRSAAESVCARRVTPETVVTCFTSVPGEVTGSSAECAVHRTQTRPVGLTTTPPRARVTCPEAQSQVS